MVYVHVSNDHGVCTCIPDKLLTMVYVHVYVYLLTMVYVHVYVYLLTMVYVHVYVYLINY